MKENDEQVRLIIFVVFCGIILFGWQYFFAPQPNLHQQTEKAVTVVEKNVEQTKISDNISSFPTNNTNVSSIDTEKYAIENGGHKFVFNTQMSFLDIENKDNPYSYFDTIGEGQTFRFYFKENNIVLTPNFVASQIESKDKMILRDNSLGITLSLDLDNEGILKFKFSSTKPYVFGTMIKSEKKEAPNRHVREFLVHSTDVKRVTVGKQDDGAELVNWYGLDFNYHLISVVLSEKKPASFVMKEDGVMTLAINDPQTNIEGKVLFTSKNYDKLVAMGDGLNLAVDFGFFGIIAVPILKGLQFFYNFFPNYGISIIILTFILRLVTFPLQYKSFKSMKKMQEVQPEVNKIREKFKDDPQRLQQETMALFKRVGANPLSGCFPILLQMPIFIAFYKVLSSAMELVGAPFYFWIYDLSLKDPYYVLPLLMIITFFIQQRMTPSATVDPTQKKVMMIMPLFFGFIMKDLPAGLNLYMFVSSFLGIFQQLLVYRLKN